MTWITPEDRDRIDKELEALSTVLAGYELTNLTLWLDSINDPKQDTASLFRSWIDSVTDDIANWPETYQKTLLEFLGTGCESRPTTRTIDVVRKELSDELDTVDDLPAAVPKAWKDMLGGLIAEAVQRELITHAETRTLVDQLYGTAMSFKRKNVLSGLLTDVVRTIVQTGVKGLITEVDRLRSLVKSASSFEDISVQGKATYLTLLRCLSTRDIIQACAGAAENPNF